MAQRLVIFQNDAERIRIVMRKHKERFAREGFSYSLRNGAQQTARLAQALLNREPSRLHRHLARSAQELAIRVSTER